MKIMKVCLFFFCMILCVGCADRGQAQETQGQVKKEEKAQEEKKEGQNTKEPINQEEQNQGQIHQDMEEQNQGLVNQDSEEQTGLGILILTDGGEKTELGAQMISKKMGEAFYDLTETDKKKIEKLAEETEYLLLGMENTEYTSYMRQYLDSDIMEGKKIAVFGVDIDESSVEMVINLLKNYEKDIKILPAFIMSSDMAMREEEEGRMNGWLTTILNDGL